MTSTHHATEWHTQDDLENDLWLYSEISDHHDLVQEPPSIAQWKAQVSSDRSASIFDTPHYHDDVTYVYSGRGRGGVSKIFRPGLAAKDVGMVEEDDVIRRMIRGVSGLGYSNELIEKSIKVKRNNETNEFVDAAEDSSSSIARSTSSETSSTRKEDIRPKSQDYPPLNATSAAPRNDKPKTPPPLNVILGKRRNKNLQRKPVENRESQPVEHLEKKPVENPERKPIENILANFEPIKDTMKELTNIDVNSDVSNETDNDYWWNNSSASTASNSSDNSSRSGPRGSPRISKENRWRRDFDREEKLFDFKSEEDFPGL